MFNKEKIDIAKTALRKLTAMAILDSEETTAILEIVTDAETFDEDRKVWADAMDDAALYAGEDFNKGVNVTENCEKMYTRETLLERIKGSSVLSAEKDKNDD